MRQLCDVISENPEYWKLYRDDFADFIDAAGEHILDLQTSREKMRGSTPSDMTLRGQQMKHKQRLWRERPHICQECGTGLTWAIYKMHHIKAVADGGTFDDDNLLMLCANCHAEGHS
jgi:5-methylcytosine-specific restriction endonuclease McrA